MGAGKQKYKLFLAIILLATGGFFVFQDVALAAPGILKQINFQGKVVNSDGTNVPDNSYNFLFCIYTTPNPSNPCTSGANNDAIWRESKNLTVNDGIFQTNLGDTTALPGSVDFNTDNIYLGVNFNNNGQMTPLIRFTAAPYAFQADNANMLGGKTWAAPGAIGSTTPASAAFTTLSSLNATNLATAAGATFGIGNSTGTGTIVSGGTSSWTNTAGNLTISTVTSGILALNSAGALNLTGAAASTWDIGANTLSLQTTNNGAITTGSGLLTLGGNLTFSGSSARTITGPSTGGLTITVASGPITLSTTTSGAMALNSAGAVTLSSNGTSSWTNTSGNLTISTATSGTLALSSAGALNLTGAAASTWSVTSGGLTINATSNTLALQTTTSGNVTITPAGTSSVQVTTGTNTGTGTSSGLSLTVNSLTSGTGLNIASSSTGITSAGANIGSLLNISTSGAMTGFTGNLASISMSGASNSSNTGSLLNINDAGTANMTKLLTLNSASTTNTTSLLSLTSATTGTIANGIVRFNFSGNRTTAGNAFQIDDASTANATTMAINSNALTTGTALQISTNNITSGSALSITSTYASGNSTNGLLYVANTGSVTNGIIGRIQSNNTSGSGLTVLASGNVGIGTSSPSALLSVAAATASRASLRIMSSGGTDPSSPNIGDLWFNGTNLYFRKDGSTSQDLLAGGGGGYNQIQDEGVNLPQRTTLNFTGSGVTCTDSGGVTLCNISGTGGGVSLAPSSADINNTSNSSIFINTTGSGNLLRLQTSGSDKFVVNNRGGLVIDGNDSSIVRTTSSHFSAGTLSNLVNTNDQLELSDGTIPNSGRGTITTSSQPTTSANIGAGALSITRADGKYLVIRGGGTTGMDIYDSIAGTFTASSQVLNGNVGAGALALPRPDGRYRVIHGGGATTTSLVDPMGVAAVGSSVAVNASSAGTVAYRRDDGRYIFTNGGAATTQIYNPVADSFTAGPSAASGTFAAGALVLPRPNGQALFINGGNNVATTNLYNSLPGTGGIGVFTTGPSLPSGCEINGAGSVALRLPNGTYLVLSKANVSTIYDPVTNTFGTCNANGPSTALGDGAHAIPLQDGKFLILAGGGSTASFIYDPSSNTFTSHGTATSAISSGSHSIMRADGTWQIIAGGGTTTTNNYNTGLPMSGSYISDDIYNTALNSNSTLHWTAQFEVPFTGTNASTNTAFSTMQFFVRTATYSGGCTGPLNSASDKEISEPGGRILPTSSTDNCVRISVLFNRPLPKRIIDERGTWTGNGSTVMRLDFVTPTLFDVSIDNSVVLRRSAADFNFPNASSSAPQNETSGPVMTRLEALTDPDRIFLPTGRIAPLTMAGTTGFYMGQFGPNHPSLPQAQTITGTIVMARHNKTFKIIASLSTPAANASLYDPASQTFISQSGSNIPTAANGPGGFALKRPDGKYLVVLGNSSATTNIYDPVTDTFSVGPSLTGNAAIGASAIPNADGTYTIVHGGGATTSSIYDPVRNTMSTGPVLTTAANCGFWAIPLTGQNTGIYKTFVGVAAGTTGVTTSMNYDSRTKTFTAGSALTAAHGCGSFVFQRQDGFWVSVAAGGGTSGASLNTTYIINPAASTASSAGMLAGPTLTCTAGTNCPLNGAHVIPRADGTFLIVSAANSTYTTIYVPNGGTWGVGAPIGSTVAGPTLPTAVGEGALSFQRPDGKWVTINGNTTNTTQIYDAGWYADGQYLSEQMNVPALAANSTLTWKQSSDNYVRMEVRYASSQAALGTTGFVSVGRPGQSIGNAGGETWLQVEINMRRDFPTFPGPLEGVYNTGGGLVYGRRTISVPTVYQYQINNGMDLLNLRTNGQDVFRIDSSGNIFASPKGGFYAVGADFAEYYASRDKLNKGDIVAVDGLDKESVRRTTSAYQKDMLGVVSTEPGFVGGNYTPDSYPIALVGRVPVNVTNENGTILAGDRITSSSLPGYGKKALSAGRTLGVAMESMEKEKMKPCFGDEFSDKEILCGQVMVFVNLSDYSGTPIAEMINAMGGNDLQLPDALPMENHAIFGNVYRDAFNVLGFLKKLDEPDSRIALNSEVLAKNVYASESVISPLIVADTLVAKNIKVETIEGLEFIQTELEKASAGAENAKTQAADLGRQIEALKTQIAALSSAKNNGETQGGLEVMAVPNFKELEIKGGLKIGGETEFHGPAFFRSIVEFLNRAVFRNSVEFAGTATFNQDTAGYAIIKEGQQSVKVSFRQAYSKPPVVNASLSLQQIKDEELRKATEELLLTLGVKFIITNVTEEGFEIRIDQVAIADIPFSWQALAVNETRTFESENSKNNKDKNAAVKSNASAPHEILPSAPTNLVSDSTRIFSEDTAVSPP